MIWTKKDLIPKLEEAKDNDIFELVKKREKSIRSLAQLRYYWWVVVDIIWDFHWLTPIETNESLKLLFKEDTFTELDTAEFKYVIETIIEMWKTKYQVEIPTPSNTWDNESLYESLWF